MYLLKRYLGLFFLLISVYTVYAQEEGIPALPVQTLVTTADNSSVVATLYAIEDDQYYFANRFIDTFQLSEANIVDIYYYENKKKKRILYDRIQQSNPYSYAPSNSAISPGKGNHYFRNVWVVTLIVELGLTDIFSLGLGVIPVEASPLIISPKLYIPTQSKTVRFAVGSYAFIFLDSGSESIFSLFGITTIGSKNNNVTLGLGHAFSAFNSGGSGVQLSAMLSNGGFAFVTDNYIFPNDFEDEFFYSALVRFYYAKAAFDLGIWGIGGTYFETVPYLGFSVNF